MKAKPLKVKNTQSIKIPPTSPIYNPKAPMIQTSPIINAKIQYFMKENSKRIQTDQSESNNLSSAAKYIQIKNNITQDVKNKIGHFYSNCSESTASSQMLGSQILGNLSVKNLNKQSHEVRKLQEQVDQLNSEILELRKSTICLRCQQNSLSQNNTKDQMKIEEKLRQSTTQIESIAIQFKKNISNGNLAISSMCSQIGKNQPNNQDIYVHQVFELQSQIKGMDKIQVELMQQKMYIQKQYRLLQQENQELKDFKSKQKVNEDEKEEKGTQTNAKTLIQRKSYDLLRAMDRINKVYDNLISKTRIIT